MTAKRITMNDSERSEQMTMYSVIGVMSGTSLDGLDIVLCTFRKKHYFWEYNILKAKTVEYTNKWRKRITNASKSSSYEFIKLHKEYGNYIGKNINIFLNKGKYDPDFISSHGHTIFHEPENRLTFQIGDGANIAATTGITTISDFRNLDTALAGQGAPLVPAGDELLFHEYDYCLNLGGFSNISFSDNNKRIAFDICPVNIILNELAGSINMNYDKDGKLGSKGSVNDKLLNELNNIDFYKQSPPKSLSGEWLENHFSPILKRHKISVPDKIRTIYEHIVFQIKKVLTGNNNNTVLITGGGAYNKFLISLLQQINNCHLIIPGKIIIEYKEALIFAFLGVLRYRNEINCLSSVTGAQYDNIGGTIFRIT